MKLVTGVSITEQPSPRVPSVGSTANGTETRHMCDNLCKSRMTSVRKSWSSTSPKKPCSCCDRTHSRTWRSGDAHWTKVLQANDLDMQALPSSLRAIFDKSSRDHKKSSGISSWRKLCSRVSRFLARSSLKTSTSTEKSLPCESASDSRTCSVDWDNVSLQSVDSCYASQPSTPSKCSSVSSAGDIEPDSPSFLTCQFPAGRTTFHFPQASTPQRRAGLDHSVSDDTNTQDSGFHLASTWPTISNGCYCNDEAYDSVFSDSEDEADTLGVHQSIRDCTIPFEDLEFGRCLREGDKHATYKGRWHGEVLIHKYKNMSEKGVCRFWSKVDQLSKLRHENVSLFMGVCPQVDHLAVITSAKKGPSLYESLHLKKDKLPLTEKVLIARQIAQGLGYLHDRGYVLEYLNSGNIHLETKVKICLVDQWTENCERDDGCSMDDELLWNVAPELSVADAEKRFTKESDIYAFGTVLYELFGGLYPEKNSADSGCDVDTLPCPTFLKNLIKGCWHREPSKRPRAVDISKKLPVNLRLQKRHSSSEPERLYKAGTR